MFFILSWSWYLTWFPTGFPRSRITSYNVCYTKLLRIRGYLTINRRAMEVVAPGGHLFTCSCSHHMQPEMFLDLLRQAAAQAGRSVRLLELRGQAYDHSYNFV